MEFTQFATAKPLWEAIGIMGQTLFGSRFIYQWFMSERAGKSIVPLGFWWISIAGSLITLIYAYHKGSVAFMISPMTGVPVYVRNLVLIYRERKRVAKASE